ncbi:hypothetical protein [Microbacterium sp. NIBRBAC000506063]|uniref:hypothetical protein n=1 Tax=Microbacterium sp. NIBRBAC000506063 TaxID=2734618 RepID=UPI001BB631DF|nr:hypothetical protein [Microbacterium sp. NIBRBAC000506063]QTV79967.1 hypothetical protein KAE78_02035 [Microbacterium sp. NIBRBAC000506063]
MNEPQIWVLIGVFSALMLGGFTLSTTLMMHSMRSSIGGVRDAMTAGFTAVDAKFAAVDAKFESLERTMDARFDAVNIKLEHLDRDVTALSRKVFGISSE